MTVTNTCNSRTARVAACVFLLVASASSAADQVHGTCEYKSAETSFRDGVAYRAANSFDATRTDLIIVLSSAAFDKDAIAKAGNRAEEVRDQAWQADRGARIELRLDAGNQVWALNYSAADSSFSQSGAGIGAITATSRSEQQFAAGFKLKGNGKQDLRCDLSFDLGVFPAAEPAAAATAASPATAEQGVRLPAGGGLPGQAYQAHLQALRSGTVDAILATLVRERATQMREHRKDADFDQMLAQIRGQAPRTITIGAGREFGDRAELAIDGIDNAGQGMSGLVVLLKEDGNWKVDRSSFKSNNRQ